MSNVKRGSVEAVTLKLMSYGLQILFNQDVPRKTPIVAIGQSDGTRLTYSLYAGDAHVGEASSKWDRSRGQVEVLREDANG